MRPDWLRIGWGGAEGRGCYNGFSPMPILDIDEIREILPHRYPMLLVDRILELEPDRIVGIKNVTLNEPFFVGHFPDFPVMPGVLIVEAMAQVAGVLVLKEIPDRASKLVLLAAIDNAKFRRPVRPGDQLRIEMKVLQEEGQRGQDARAGHRGRRGGGRGRSDVQAGRQGCRRRPGNARCRFIRPPSSTRRADRPRPPTSGPSASSAPRSRSAPARA